MNPLDPSAIQEIEIPKAKVDPEPKSPYLSREDWLNNAGVLKEEEKHIDGLGLLVLSEITGDQRAEIVGHQSEGLLAEKRKIDAKAYQRSLILAGVVDPSTPRGDRKPMFRPTDLDRVMKIGGGKIAEVVDVIEKLSALGNYSGAAEENSDATPNGDGTSK